MKLKEKKKKPLIAKGKKRPPYTIDGKKLSDFIFHQGSHD